MGALPFNVGDEVRVLSSQIFFHIPKHPEFNAEGLVGTVTRAYDADKEKLSPVHPCIVSFTEPRKWKVRQWPCPAVTSEASSLFRPEVP